MTHPPRFLQKILARPGDDEPRLQYANWLDGCGNPLGEFIRLQCLLAQNPISQPHLYFERREQELLALFQGVWSRTLAGRVQWCSFRRGFIEEVALTDRQWFLHAPDLFRAAPVLDVHLHWQGSKLNKLPRAADIGHTMFVDVSSQRLGDASVARLADSPLLTQVHGLNLSSNHLSDDSLDALHDSPHLGNLRELYLSDNPITDEGIRSFVMSPIVEQLDVLDVRFTRIREDSIEVLSHILGDRLLY